MTKRRLLMHTAVFFALLTAFSRDAEAYLDPGTGSYVLQLLVAAVLGAMFTIKLYWRKVKDFLTSFGTRSRADDERNPDR